MLVYAEGSHKRMSIKRACERSLPCMSELDSEQRAVQFCRSWIGKLVQSNAVSKKNTF